MRYCVTGALYCDMEGGAGWNVYVRDNEGLRELLASMGGTSFVALDTEFMRERTYYARLCLVQVATDDVQAIVDPLAIDDLSPLLEFFYDTAVTKVLHAGSQDLEIFFRLGGRVPAPVFDTQVAATLAGFPTQVGYGALVHELVGVKLDKSDTFTDWSRRPLSGTQIEYALNDVRHLPAIYHALRDRLETEGRLSWLEPDFDAMVDPATYDLVPEEQFRRLKRISSLTPPQLGVLMCVTAWREREARRRDMPRRWIVGDESLVEIARRAPRDNEELGKIRGVADKLAKSSYNGVLDAVRRGLELSEDELPYIERRRRRQLDVDGAVDLMAALVRLRAKQHNIATPLLASRDELRRLAGGEREGSALLESWRRSIVGEELLELLDGRRSMRLADGRLVVDECGADTEGDGSG